jgi:prepilin-type N-terminal cleavage/methylation domain-containing protein
MEAPMRRRLGFSLVEVLVALTVFAVVLAIAGSGIVQALRLQQLNESATSLQAKLRRVTEVIGQDLRSSMFGALTASPVVSDDASVSVMLATGNGDYQVLPAGGGSFSNSAQLNIFADAASAAALGIDGRTVVLTNSAGAGIVFEVTNVSRVGGPSSREWNIVHAGCNNTIAWDEGTRLSVVDLTGYTFDADTGVLSRQRVGGAARALAFDLSGFEVAYTYVGDDGGTLNRTTPFASGGGAPLRVAVDGGVTYVLDSLRVTVSAEEPVAGRVVTRSYVAQIAMPSTGSASLASVVTCP